jgi:preprotein translocase subunit SecA
MGVLEDFLAGTDKETRKKENDIYLQTLQKRVLAINDLEPTIEDLSDDELIAKTSEFRKRLVDKGEDINGPILEEAFAVVREAAWYVMLCCCYDVVLCCVMLCYVVVVMCMYNIYALCMLPKWTMMRI